MKKPGLFLYSVFVTGGLTILLAAFIGYVSFFMNDHSEISARILIYNAKWIEALLLLLFLNLLASIFINKLYVPKKWPLFLLHLAFILILAGGAITRYVDKEGNMKLQEEETTDYIISEEKLDQLVMAEYSNYHDLTV